jgi:hypothetical protein
VNATRSEQAYLPTILEHEAKAIVGLRPIISGPRTLGCKVPRHALQFVSGHPLQLCGLHAVAAGRESGKRYAFSKAAEPPSFPPWLEFSMSQ